MTTGSCSPYEIAIPKTTTTYQLNNLMKAPIYNFKFTVYNSCIVYSVWYPDPDDIGSFIHQTMGDPITVSFSPFLYTA
jgi:hypothetical protein